jgi:hypothetical protein
MSKPSIDPNISEGDTSGKSTPQITSMNDYARFRDWYNEEQRKKAEAKKLKKHEYFSTLYPREKRSCRLALYQLQFV